MSKKKSCLFCLYCLVALATLAGVAVAVLRHEPAFYRTRLLEPDGARKQRSLKFLNDFAQLCINVQGGGPEQWHFTFDEAAINSFFEEDFMTKGDVENLHKLGISEPRVAFEDGVIRFAFRYGSGFWSTVLSYELHVWAVPKEPNVLAVEIRGRRVGALPMSSQALLSELTEIAARHNVEVLAYRHEGHPVALIRFQADQANPTTQLKCLKVEPGVLHVGGACTSSGAPPKGLAAAVN